MDQIRNIVLTVESLKAEKKFDEALKVLEKSVVKYGSDYRIYEEIADIYLFSGELQKAEKAINFALTMNKESATGNYLKGFILLSQDKISSSIPYLEKSNTLLANNPEVLRNMGWAYAMCGQAERGVTILSRALNISPEDDLIKEDLAIALISSGRTKEGEYVRETIKKQ